jgi:hypothetical protein
MTHPGKPLDHHGDPLKGPQVGVEPGCHGALQQNLLDLGELDVGHLGVGAGWPAAAQGVHAALGEAAMPAADGLRGDAQLAGDLGLGAALGEQLGGAQASGLACGAFLGRAGAAAGRHPRMLTHHPPSSHLNPRNSNKGPAGGADTQPSQWVSRAVVARHRV